MTRTAPRRSSAPRPRALFAALLLAAPIAFPVALSSCASVDFQRTSANAGRFESKASSLTLFGFDFPSHALITARANASDAAQPNTVATYERVMPYLGPFDWLLDIISFRWAKVEGTWGYE